MGRFVLAWDVNNSTRKQMDRVICLLCVEKIINLDLKLHLEFINFDSF